MSSERHPLSLRHAPRLVVLLIVTAASLGGGSPHAAASGAGSFTMAQLAAQDDHHVTTRTEAEQRTSPFATERRRPWVRTFANVRSAARALRRHVGRWQQSPPAWRGPPVLLI